MIPKGFLISLAADSVSYWFMMLTEGDIIFI